MALAAAPQIEFSQLEALYADDPPRKAELSAIVKLMASRGQAQLFRAAPSVNDQLIDLVRLLEKVQLVSTGVFTFCYMVDNSPLHTK